MKKYLLLFGIIQITSFGTLYSQGTGNITLPTEAVRKMYVAAEQGRILSDLVTILNARIEELQLLIDDLKDKDMNNYEIIQTYKSEIRIMQEQRAVFEKQIADLNAEIKKLKRKNFWTSVGGIAAAIGIIYLTR